MSITGTISAGPIPFARPENTSRQRGYSRAAGHRSIYTPQMVIGGVDHVIGFKPMKLADFVMAHKAAMGSVGLEATLDGARVHLRAWPSEGADLPARLVVDIVGFDPEATVDIERGENAGRTITYANIVRSWARLGSWDGQGEWQADVDLPEASGVALIVQAEGPGAILGALRLR